MERYRWRYGNDGGWFPDPVQALFYGPAIYLYLAVKQSRLTTVRESGASECGSQ